MVLTLAITLSICAPRFAHRKLAPAQMKKNKYLSLVLFVAFSVLGAYLLKDSLYDTGPYAEETVIVGAIFCSLALASMAWAVRQHLMSKVLRRHLHRHHS